MSICFNVGLGLLLKEVRGFVSLSSSVPLPGKTSKIKAAITQLANIYTKGVSEELPAPNPEFKVQSMPGLKQQAENFFPLFSAFYMLIWSCLEMERSIWFCLFQLHLTLEGE